MPVTRAPYSIYRHLARALWPNLKGGEVLFMVYGMTCYYDASSKEEVHDRPLVLVGVAATEAKWTLFEERWAAILAEKNIEYFDSAACSGWHGEYAIWNRDNDVRNAFLESLSSTIADTAAHFVHAWMYPADWHAVNREYVLDQGDILSSSPYALLATLGGQLLERNLEASPFLTAGYQLVHVLEYGDRGQGRLRHLIERGEIPFSVQKKWDKKTGHKVHAFAACDLIAYYVRRAIERHAARGAKEVPLTLAKHLSKLPNPYEIHADATHLRRICERFPEDFPKRESQA